jgi:hypothetical protein
MHYHTRGNRGFGGLRRPSVAALAAVAALVALVTGCSGQTPSTSPPSSPPPGALVSPSAGTGTQGSGTVSPNQEAAGAGDESGVTGGDLFGGNTGMAVESAALGRRLAIVRTYYTLGESYPRPEDRLWLSQGATEMVSLDTLPGMATYADIAAGREDATISAFLQEIERAAVHYDLPAIYFCFEHEADTAAHHRGLGSPAQFVQAWDHIHALAVAGHLDWNDGGRIRWVLILTHEAFIPLGLRPRWAMSDQAPNAWFPGRGEVDVIAADGYESYGCEYKQPSDDGSDGREANLLQQLFEPVVAFAHANGGLPVFITEWGSTSFPTSALQVSFIHQMQAFVDANREVVGAMYWDNTGIGPHCNYIINSNRPAVSAMAAFGQSPVMQGHLTS